MSKKTQKNTEKKQLESIIKNHVGNTSVGKARKVSFVSETPISEEMRNSAQKVEVEVTHKNGSKETKRYFVKKMTDPKETKNEYSRVNLATKAGCDVLAAIDGSEESGNIVYEFLEGITLENYLNDINLKHIDFQNSQPKKFTEKELLEESITRYDTNNRLHNTRKDILKKVLTTLTNNAEKLGNYNSPDIEKILGKEESIDETKKKYSDEIENKIFGRLKKFKNTPSQTFNSENHESIEKGIKAFIEQYAITVLKNEKFKSIIHGDAHPGNVILDKEGNIKVIDLETLQRGNPSIDIYTTLAYQNSEEEFKILEEFIDDTLKDENKNLFKNSLIKTYGKNTKEEFLKEYNYVSLFKSLRTGAMFGNLMKNETNDEKIQNYKEKAKNSFDKSKEYFKRIYQTFQGNDKKIFQRLFGEDNNLENRFNEWVDYYKGEINSLDIEIEGFNKNKILEKIKNNYSKMGKIMGTTALAISILAGTYGILSNNNTEDNKFQKNKTNLEQTVNQETFTNEENWGNVKKEFEYSLMNIKSNQAIWNVKTKNINGTKHVKEKDLKDAIKLGFIKNNRDNLHVYDQNNITVKNNNGKYTLTAHFGDKFPVINNEYLLCHAINKEGIITRTQDELRSGIDPKDLDWIEYKCHLKKTLSKKEVREMLNKKIEGKYAFNEIYDTSLKNCPPNGCRINNIQSRNALNELPTNMPFYINGRTPSYYSDQRNDRNRGDRK